MKKLFSIILAAFCLCTMLCAVACSDNKYSSYWQVNKLIASDDENDVMTQYVEVTLGDNDMREFWMNISYMSVTETTIGYVFGSSSTLNKVTVQRSFILDSDGWYKFEASGSSKTFKITVTDQMRINEIVFINDDDEVMEFEFSKYVIRPSFTSTQHQTFTKEDLEEKGEKNNALCAFDEQDLFDLEEANAALKKAEEAHKDDSTDSTESSSN